MSRQPGFLEPDDRYALLSKAGDPLERLTSGFGGEFRSVSFPAGEGAVGPPIHYGKSTRSDLRLWPTDGNERLMAFS